MAAHAALAVDQPADRGRAFIQLDHALGIKQHVRLLRELELEAITAAPGRRALSVETHSAIPLCQTRSAVTV
ncbi:MAG: hypothetical protein VB137_10065 [Burkholderia sp.]